MIILAWIVSLGFSAYIGYRFKEVKTKFETLQELLKAKLDKPEKTEQNKSALYDPYDVAQRAKWEQDKLNRQLNDK